MQCYTISTGSNELNKLLGGGMEAQAITEMHGEWRTGKTQICHTMCITAQIPVPETGYPGGRVIYIDTEGGYNPSSTHILLTHTYRHRHRPTQTHPLR
jgi:meiotic recombination protein DMC1